MVVDYWLPALCNPRLLDNPITANRMSLVFALFNNILSSSRRRPPELWRSRQIALAA
jgi:hypothetical protein